MLITDGRTGASAKVSQAGLVNVAAESRRIVALAAEQGKSFSCVSGFITLTAGSEKGVLKVQFNEVPEAHLDRVVLQSDAAVRWRMYNKATSDTFSVVRTPVNLDTATNTALSCNMYIGDNTATIIGGSLVFAGMSNANQFLDLDLDGGFHFTPNSTLYITAEGAATVSANVILYDFCIDDF